MERFADEALIEVSSGAGGNGCVAFRRERFVPHGGPAGGDGGRGGDVIFTVRRDLRTLAHLRYRHLFKAESGQDGQGAGCYGRNGEHTIIPVPPGTALFDADTGELIHDFGSNEADFVFLRGGNGGWGNIHFKSSVNQAPQKALPGQPAVHKSLRVELRLIADIGLVGFPNAGKSSLLDRFTNARPKIAPYPFTTKIPNLGVLTIAERDIILADIPGILEGASEGLGLGIHFLKHISRTAALAFIIDVSDEQFITAFDVLCHELTAFSSALSKKRRIIVASKTDTEYAAEHLEQLREKYPNEHIIGVSVYSGQGIEELSRCFLQLVSSKDTEVHEEILNNPV
ncbi:MAG: GTPase ObgE [Spirochaetaceae bacterium]|jgi:GTP-binding protein|nr:GTPase ObgE [Spirochaetaceae bacterium]